MKRLFIPIISLIVPALALGACAAPEAKRALSIDSAISSIGGDPSNPAEQWLSYSFILKNNGPAAVTVRYAEPILLAPFASKVKGTDFRVTVNAALGAGDYTEIKGVLPFDAGGMTKEQILAMEPFFKDVDINTDRVLAVFGQT